MSQTFRSLAEILRSEHQAQNNEPEPVRTVFESAMLTAATDEVDRSNAVTAERAALVEWCSSLALVRLAAKEAYDRAARRLLEAFADHILARELALEPVDVAALLSATVEAFSAEEPVALALCPADAERISNDLPVRVDPSLAPGDLVLVVRDGTIDARLALRVEAALDEVLE